MIRRGAPLAPWSRAAALWTWVWATAAGLSAAWGQVQVLPGDGAPPRAEPIEPITVTPVDPVVPRAEPIVVSPVLQDPAAEIATIHALFERKQFAQAIQGYRRFLADFPGEPEREEAFYKMGDALRQLGKWGEAAKAFESLLREFPSGPLAPFAQLRLGEVRLKAGDPAGAVEPLQRAAKGAKGAGVRLNAQFYLVQALQKAGRAAEAVPTLEQLAAAGDKNPFKAYAHLALGRFAEADGKREQALQAFKRALSQADSKAMSGEASVRAGSVALALEQPSEAATLFETARRLAVPEPWIRHANLGLARAQFALKHYKALIELIPAIRDAVPDGTRPELMYYLANAQRLTGQPQAALRSYDMVLAEGRTGPLGEAAAMERVFVLADARSPETERATAQFLTQFSESDQAPTVRYLRADYLFSSNRWDEVIPLLEQVVNEGKPPGVQEDALFKLGTAHFRKEQFDAAAKRLAQLLEAHPKTGVAVNALWQLAVAQEQLDRSEAALQAYEELIQRAPKSDLATQALFRCGLLLGQMRKLQEARDRLTQFLNRAPESPDAGAARFWRGWAAFEQDDWRAAEADLKAARDSGAGPYPLATPRLIFAAYQLEDLEKLDGYVQDWDAYQKASPAAGQPIDPGIVFWAAERFATQKQWEKAVSYFSRLTDSEDRALRINALSESARALICLGQFASAAARIGTLIEAYPEYANSPKLLVLRGFALLGARAWDEALQTGNALVRLQSQGRVNAMGRWIGAEALRGAGQFKEAARGYASVAALFTDPDLVPEAMRRQAACLRAVGKPEEAVAVRDEFAKRFPNEPWRDVDPAGQEASRCPPELDETSG